ncbi:ester cyclase [Halomarina ordinaria]|uniref:Ester cyclase n=1 Tax=Halomarina ordinaria TaxID=3033939 RepID=A0ABD5U805_9EURY|nr:ester cyclase [Halomarina sp. PSRA2]
MANEVHETEEMKGAAMGFVEEVWNGRHYELIEQKIDEGYAGHWFAVGEDGPVDRDGLREFVTAVHRGFPDFHMDVEFVLAEGDMVAVGYTSGGTHQGEFMGIPPTGEYGEATGVFVNRFEEGRVVESWASWDALGLFQDVGVIPEAFGLTNLLGTGLSMARRNVTERARKRRAR